MVRPGKVFRAQAILDLLRIRREEVAGVLLMTTYFFLAMSSGNVVRSLQNALYLGHVGFDFRLPLLYLVLAFLSIGVVLFYRRMARRYSRVRVSVLTLGLLILCVFLFAAPITRGEDWVYPVFYLWGGVFSLLVPTQGWLLSYELYTTREAKRLFAILGTGGILGGAFGGFYAAYLSSRVGPVWLLMNVAVGLGLMQVVLIAIQRQSRGDQNRRSLRPQLEGEDASEIDQASFSSLFRSRYVLTLAGLVLVVGATTTVIDLQFKWLLDSHYAGSTARITRFFGLFLGVMFSLSAGIQLLGTSRLLRRLGVAITLLLLPIALAFGLVPAAIGGTFWLMIWPKLIDGSLRSSVHRVSVELLYIPIEGRQTITAKGFIDLVVTRLGDAVGAFVLLGAVSGLAIGVDALSWIIAAGAFVWLLLAVKVGSEYVQHLRSTLVTDRDRDLSGSWLRKEVGGEIVLEALDSPSPSKVLLALKLLSLDENRYLAAAGQPADIPDITGSYRVLPWLAKVMPLVEHENRRVAAAALHLLMTHDPVTYEAKLTQCCTERRLPDLLRLSYLDQYEEDLSKYLTSDLLLSWVDQADEESSLILSRLMGRMKEPAYLPQLRVWAQSDSPRLAGAALAALGHFRSPEDVEAMIHALHDASRREAARIALGRFGDAVVPELMRLVRQPETSAPIRGSVPLVLGDIATETAQAALFNCLYLQDSVISFRSLKSLNKIRARGRLLFDADYFIPILQVWAREHYELINLNLLLDGKAASGTGRLLEKTVTDRIDLGIERIFRGLALFLRATDAHHSYLAFIGRQKLLRENAIELIDSLVKGEIRQTIMPILTEETQVRKAEIGRKMFQLSQDLTVVLSDALFQADPWLKACLIAWIKGEDLSRLKARVVNACEDRNPLVRETAEWALATWGS